MSIDSVLQIAVSALNTSQAALRTAANNIANVNTPGYARQIVEQETQVIGTLGAGVRVAEIRRIVDEFLIAEVSKASSEAEAYQVQSALHDRIQALLGGPDDDTTLTAQLSRVFASLAELTVDAGSAVLRSAALSDLQAFGDQVSRLAQQVQGLRAETDRQIAADLSKVNNALARIHDLNLAIARETLSGREAAALIDQRSQAISEIAEVIDIRVSDLGVGVIGISTGSGITLLDNVPRKLVYAGPGAVTSATRFPQITVAKVDPVTGVVDATGVPLDAGVRSGRLRGYLDMRNQQLPDLAAQLGELASKIIDQLNAVHNDNTAVPPPTSLTGRNTGLVGGDAHGFTGKVTLAVVNTSNQIASSFVIDFSSYTTLNDVIGGVNAALSGAATLTLANGVLTFSAANPSDGVAVLQDATDPSSRGGRGFAHFFGLNDLMEAKVPAHYDTGFTGSNSHNFTGTVTFELRGPDGQVPIQYVLDFGALGGTDFTALINDLNAKMGAFVTFSLDSVGRLAATPASSFAGYEIVTVSDTTGRGGTGVRLSELFGIGDRWRADAALDISVTSRIRSDNNLFALAKLDVAAPSGMPALTDGDARGALGFQDLAQASVQFAAVGGLSQTQATLSGYAALIIAQVSINAEHIDRLRDDGQALRDALQERLDAVSGVNLDEELANMIVFETAYNASARLIAVANKMFETLLSVVG